MTQANRLWIQTSYPVAYRASAFLSILSPSAVGSREKLPYVDIVGPENLRRLTDVHLLHEFLCPGGSHLAAVVGVLGHGDVGVTEPVGGHPGGEAVP